MSTTPLTKKQLVIAGVTTAGLLLSPSVLADENAQASPLVGTVASATQASSGSEPEISREPVIAKAAIPISVATDSSDPSAILSSEPVSEVAESSETTSQVPSKATSSVASPSQSQPASARAVTAMASSPKITPSPVSEADLAQVDTSDIQGQAHLQTKGWQKPTAATQRFGTVGESRRLEAISFSLNQDMAKLGDLVYQSHVQDIGWQAAVTSGHISGTTGQSRRLEAINMRLTAELAAHFDLYYRTHIQDYGWLGWAKNGANAGTEGLSKRLEAIEVQLLPKGALFKGDLTRSFIKKGQQTAGIVYRAYIEDQGWQSERSNGALSGSTGRNQQIEALGIRLQSDYLGHVSYQTHIENIGWVSAVRDGKVSGQGGSHRQIEAVKISLVGEISKHYDLYYRVHSQKKGWLGWTKNGLAAGTEGFTLGVEGLEVTLVQKGGKAPGTTANSFMKKGTVVKTKTYPMPYFNQRDPRWVNKYYGRYTMGDTGCVPTSLGMVFSALTGKTVMPTTVADWLYHHTNEFNKAVPGTRAPGIVKAAGAWGLKATNLSSYNHIVSALRDGHYVVAGVQNNVFVAHTSHEIVLKGYNNGMVHVTDPYTQSLSGWYAMSYLFNTKSTDKDDTALGLPFFKISQV